MKDLPKTGTRQELRFVVTAAETIQFTNLPPILSTPALLWHLEQAALRLMLAYLDDGEITVGTSVEMEHVGPALVGDEVLCQAVVVQGSGTEIIFRVEATRHDQAICRGLHRRKIVKVESLRRRLVSI